MGHDGSAVGGLKTFPLVEPHRRLVLFESDQTDAVQVAVAGDLRGQIQKPTADPLPAVFRVKGDAGYIISVGKFKFIVRP